MDQFERLKGDIEDSRADLQGNLRELERKAEDLADWRYQFRKRPAVLLGAAVAGGALLGMHGDRVVVRIERVSDGRIEGRIVRILERGSASVVGRFDLDGSGLGFVVPFDRRLIMCS